jgi:phage tail protein X
MSKYITSEGDMVDAIAYEYYGTHTGTTVAIYEANPGLVDHGPQLPAGLTITLPDLPTPEPIQIRLYD